MVERKISPLYRVIRWLVRVIYPRITVKGMENVPDEPVVFVSNHAQMNGPIACELYLPETCKTWCAGQMMNLREVPAYAFQDFWSQKPAYTHWFYRLASYVIAPLSVVVFNNARTIGVYHDGRIASTYRETLRHLKEGGSVVIFPEHDCKHNHIVYDFQEGFVDVATMHYRRTGQALCFVPVYITPRLKTMEIGAPIRYCPENAAAEERKRVCTYLMQAITDIAQRMPRHTVVPYRNIPRREYPSNIADEVTESEKTGC